MMTGPARLSEMIRRHSGPMKLAGNIVIFGMLFSLIFFFLHAADVIKTAIGDDLQYLGGLLWLCSAVCFIFSTLAGFVIQHEWDQWNDLMDAIKGEVGALRSLWLWSHHSPDRGMTLRRAIHQSLLVTIQNEWREHSLDESESAGRALAVVQEETSELVRDSGLTITPLESLAIFCDIGNTASIQASGACRPC